jgi:hypothetical protein
VNLALLLEVSQAEGKSRAVLLRYGSVRFNAQLMSLPDQEKLSIGHFDSIRR